MITLTTQKDYILKLTESSFILKSDLSENKPVPIMHYLMDDDSASLVVLDDQEFNNGTSIRNTEDMTTAGKVNGALNFLGTKSPLYHWKLNDDTTSTVIDDTRNNLNLVSSVNTDEMSVSGKINKAINFNGVLSDTSLISHWKLSDGTDAKGRFNGTPEAGVSFGPGKIGDSATFSGTATGSIGFANGVMDDIGNGGAFSLACWCFRETGTTGDGGETLCAFSFDFANDKGLIWRISTTNNNIFFHFGTENYQMAYTVPFNEDVHLAVTHTGDQTSLYVNGVFEETITTEEFVIGGPEDRIGREFVRYFKGKLDDFRLYNKAISAGEVNAIWADGNGTESINKLESGSYTDGDSRSYAFWYNQNTIPSGTRLGKLGETYFFCDSTGHMFITYFNGSGFPGSTHASAGGNNEDHHCVITVEQNGGNTAVKIYIDGVLDVDEDMSGNRATGTDLNFGQSDNFNFWRGILDDIRVYDSVLTLQDVEQLYQSDTGTEVSDVLGDKITMNNSGISDAPMSFSFWIKTTDTNGSIYEERGLSPDPSGGWKVVMNSGKLRFTSYAVKDYANSLGTINDGVRHNVVVIMKSDFDVDYYIDNELDSTAPGDTDMRGTTTNGVIGANYGDANNGYPVPKVNFVGDLDDMRIYDRGLS